MITKYIIASFIIIDFIAIIGQIVRNVRFCKRLLIKLHYFRIKFEYDQLLHNLMNKRPHFTVKFICKSINDTPNPIDKSISL